MLLRRIIREETGITPVVPAEKWRGGTLVLRPANAQLQEKSWPIETFFHKVVMLRNRLRTLEQQVNGAELPEDLKVKLQGYISGCYGSLTSFNVLFAEESDQFKGAGENKKPVNWSRTGEPENRVAGGAEPANLRLRWAHTSTSSRSPASFASAT